MVERTKRNGICIEFHKKGEIAASSAIFLLSFFDNYDKMSIFATKFKTWVSYGNEFKEQFRQHVSKRIDD